MNWPINGKAIEKKLKIQPEILQRRSFNNMEIVFTSDYNYYALLKRTLDLKSETLIIKPFHAILLRIF